MSKSGTTKKPASKTTKSKAAKTTSTKAKTTSKKVTAKAKTVKKPTTKSSSSNLLRNLHLASAIVYALLAVAAWFVMKAQTFTISIGYWAKDQLASEAANKTVLAPAIRAVYDVQLRYALIVLLVLSMIVPILYLTRLKKTYAESLDKKVNVWRWVDFGVTLALVTEIIVLLNGATDLPMIKVAGALIALTCGLGWLAETQNKTATKPVWSAFVLSLVAGALPWLIILHYLIATPLYGMVWAPWYVYAATGTTLVLFCAIAVNEYLGYRSYKSWKYYQNVERNYVVLGMLAKVAVAAFLIAGIR